MSFYVVRLIDITQQELHLLLHLTQNSTYYLPWVWLFLNRLPAILHSIVDFFIRPAILVQRNLLLALQFFIMRVFESQVSLVVLVVTATSMATMVAPTVVNNRSAVRQRVPYTCCDGKWSSSFQTLANSSVPEGSETLCSTYPRRVPRVGKCNR